MPETLSVSTNADSNDLPTLSINAAIELDRLLSGKVIDVEVITKFLDGLGNISGNNSGSVERALLADPLTVDVFSRAVQNTDGGVKSLDELAEKVFSLIAKIRTASATSSSDVVAELKRFCISLHQASLAESMLAAEANDQMVTDELANV